jgi:hypothetical protein
VRQFFGASLGRVSEEMMEEAREVLGTRLYAPFALMPRPLRRHALDVYARVKAMEGTNRDLLRAALLHDSGKHDPISGRYVTLPHRVAIVLLRATGPGKRVLSRLAEYSDPRGVGGLILYPFHLSRHHAERAARRAAQLGASERTVRLIATHHTPGDHLPGGSDPDLWLLQAADEAS